MPGAEVSLQRENSVVVIVVQALLGFVSPPLYGVSVEVTPTVVTLFFAIKDGDDEEMDEDIDHIVAEVRRLLAPDPPEVRRRIHVGPVRWPAWEGYQHGRRLVYASRDKGGDEDVSDDAS